jgi:hypothetical protein
MLPWFSKQFGSGGAAGMIAALLGAISGLAIGVAFHLQLINQSVVLTDPEHK